MQQAMNPSNGRAKTIAIVVSALTWEEVQRGDVANQYGTGNFDVTSHCTIGPFKDSDQCFAQ
jgi:DNA primase